MIDVKDLKKRMNEHELSIAPSLSMYFNIYLHYEYDGWKENIVGYRMTIDYDSVTLTYRENRMEYPTNFRDVKISNIEEFRDLMMNKFVPYMMGLTEENINAFDKDKFNLEALHLVRTDTGAVYEFEDFINIFKHCFKEPKKKINNKYRSTTGFERKDM